MEKKVESGTALIIKGRTFELVWDDSKAYFIPCHRCDLHYDLCQHLGGDALLALCEYIQPETNTYFVERKQEIANG